MNPSKISRKKPRTQILWKFSNPRLKIPARPWKYDQDVLAEPIIKFLVKYVRNAVNFFQWKGFLTPAAARRANPSKETLAEEIFPPPITKAMLLKNARTL